MKKRIRATNDGARVTTIAIKHRRNSATGSREPQSITIVPTKRKARATTVDERAPVTTRVLRDRKNAGVKWKARATTVDSTEKPNAEDNPNSTVKPNEGDLQHENQSSVAKYGIIGIFYLTFS